MSEKAGDVPLIYRLGLVEAKHTGLIVHSGNVGDQKVYVSRRLLNGGFANKKMRVDMIERGLELLQKRHPGDEQGIHVRYLDVYEVWVVRTEDGITYLKNSDL